MTKPLRIFALFSGCLVLAACATPKQATQVPQMTLAPRLSLPALPPEGEPADLAGLGAGQLRSAFGTPAFVRKEGANELWRYDGANCKAFFFLYANDGSLKLRHVETVPRGAQMAADPNCLSALKLGQPVS